MRPNKLKSELIGLSLGQAVALSMQMEIYEHDYLFPVLAEIARRSGRNHEAFIFDRIAHQAGLNTYVLHQLYLVIEKNEHIMWPRLSWMQKQISNINLLLSNLQYFVRVETSIQSGGSFDLITNQLLTIALLKNKEVYPYLSAVALSKGEKRIARMFERMALLGMKQNLECIRIREIVFNEKEPQKPQA
nr:hypothetical protein [Chlorokybus atmophyticus]